MTDPDRPTVPTVVSVAVPVPVEQSFSYTVPDGMRVPELGCRVIVPFGRRTLTGVVVGTAETTEGVKLKPISRVIDGEPLFDQEYLGLARWVADYYLASLGEVISAMIPSARRGKELPILSGDEPSEAPSGAPEGLTLSDEQLSALSAILGRDGHGESDQPPGSDQHPQGDQHGLGARGSELFYLYGITGSGKTEVFLQAAESVMAAGKSVIYLVPEIALTHQLFDHIHARFGDRVAMLHSGLTPSERLGEWQRLRRGDAHMVVGARSAIFAPVQRLGLVVVDEEHEGSYKAGSVPRYHARQVALRRAMQAGARCVLGSATPSVEAWHLMQQGQLHRLDLTRRLSGGAMPSIRVINMRRSPGVLSAPLLTALRETKAEGAQSILFLNRRGFASVLLCQSCGHAMECPHCSVPMTWHKSRDRMVCHYCGYQAHPHSVCPECASLDLRLTGFGTERVEEDLARELPELRVARLDTDTTARRGALREILDRFASRDVDVLLGTQMVAKGLNFPAVRTVGIVMADTGMSLPDFRAAERSFSLIVQVAGRAGRYRPDGQVFVQTMRPEHPAIERASTMDIAEFYRNEIAVRQELGYPPFSRMVRCVVRSARRDRAEAEARRLGGDVSRSAGDAGLGDIDVLGPAPAPLERVNRSWRYQIILKGPRISAIVSVLRPVLVGFRSARDVYIEVDVDPVNLL